MRQLLMCALAQFLKQLWQNVCYGQQFNDK
jgi:hypothetical protein